MKSGRLQVHLKGNFAITDAVQPILTMIENYTTQYPDKPICLMGVSNGGRIALELEYRLREQSRNPIKVSIVAGAVLGTKRIDLLKRLGLGRCLNNEIVNDLSYLSEDACARIDHIREELPPNIIRSYRFYASTEDLQIKPYNASLPILYKEETHTVVHGVNHNSIVSSVAERQLECCLSWMQTYSGAGDYSSDG